MTEIVSGLSRKRRSFLSCSQTLSVTTIAVELIVIDDAEVDDGVARGITEAFNSFCARFYGRRASAHRAAKALSAAREASDAA